MGKAAYYMYFIREVPLDYEFRSRYVLEIDDLMFMDVDKIQPDGSYLYPATCEKHQVSCLVLACLPDVIQFVHEQRQKAEREKERDLMYPYFVVLTFIIAVFVSLSAFFSSRRPPSRPTRRLPGPSGRLKIAREILAPHDM